MYANTHHQHRPRAAGRESLRRRVYFLWALLLLLGPVANLAPDSWLGEMLLPAEAAAATAAPACTDNPFGSQYDLFGEGEIFVGYRDGGTSPVLLSNNSLDLQPNPTDLALVEKNLFLEDTQPWGRSIQAQAVTAADLDGDGQTEMVQSFVSGDAGQPGYYVATFDAAYAVTYSRISQDSHSRLAVAAGNLLGGDDEREQVVLVAVDDVTGALTILVWDGTVNGQTLVPLASFRSTAGVRAHASSLDVAVGSITGDRQDDILVSLLDAKGETIETILLVYDPTYSDFSDDDNQANRLRVVDAVPLQAGQFRSVQAATVRLNGDFRDEVVVAADTDDPNAQGVSPQIRLFAFRYLPLQADPVQGNLSRWTELDATVQASTTNFALAAGDVDGESPEETTVSPEEIVVGFHSTGNANYGSGFVVDVWQAKKLDTSEPVLMSHEQWTSNNQERSQATALSLAVADLDNDGQQEIVAALDDGRGLEVLYLTFADLVADAPQLPLAQRVNLDATNLIGATSLAVGDRDNDALKAVYSAECKRITEQRVMAVGFAPPHWGVIQGDVVKSVAIGQTQSTEVITTTALSFSRSDTVSGYLGASVGLNLFDVIAVESSARTTAAQTKSESRTNGDSTGTGESFHVQRTGSDDFVIFENTDYNCYAYTLTQHGTAVPESTLRNCEYLISSRLATHLDAWDNTWGWQPAGLNQALSWTPVARDWASLGLFRGDFTAQSSTFQGQGAERAVDGILHSNPDNNSVATTEVQDNPWWQIDLGQVQPISKVRIWNRTDWLSCDDLNACPNQLDHIYVLISDTDFRTMPEEGNPTALMARPDVHAFSLADLVGVLPGVTVGDPLGRVTTFLTLDGGTPAQPVQGRFVRVQRVLPNARLSLGEVQVFGANHVDPDRYPVEIREKGTATDGLFEVRMYDPLKGAWVWVEVRGNLLWNRTGYAKGALSGERISVGNISLEWTYSKYSQGSSFTTKSLGVESSIGFEFDFTAGSTVKLQAGYGQTFASGTTREYTMETSWSDALEFGGSIKGFPSDYETQQWVRKCEYEIRPYYYEITEVSTFGQETRYPVLDYIVPDSSAPDADGNNSAGLDRTDAAAMANCANGNQTGSTPQARNDQVSAVTGSTTTFQVLSNDVGNQLHIVDVSQPQHGQAAFSSRSITYTPAAGFLGEDTFTYTASDGVTSSQGTITVTVAPRPIFLPLVVR